MIKKAFIFSFIFICTTASFSQKNELGIFAGVSYYLGDLNPSIHFLQSKPATGIVFRHNLNNRLSIRLNAAIGQLVGDDALSNENTQRNLSFKTIIIDASSFLEINFLPFAPGEMEYTYTPYIFGGIGVGKFNSKANLNDEWVELQPLATEGQKDLYKRATLTLPFGAGIKFNLNSFVTIELEWGMRKLFTDYLDDVSGTYQPYGSSLNGNSLYDRSSSIGEEQNTLYSQRGNAQTKDWYSFAGVIMTYKIRNKQKPCGAYQTKNYSKKNSLNIF